MLNGFVRQLDESNSGSGDGWFNVLRIRLLGIRRRLHGVRMRDSEDNRDVSN